MQETDKARFVNVLKGLAAIKPGVKLTDESYEIYWLTMREWSFDEFQAAAVHLASSNEFMPNPYHFEQLRKASRPIAAEAWAKVLHFARHSYRPRGDHVIDPQVEFDSTTLHAVETIGGFGAIAMSDPSSTQFLQKRFAENYDALQDVQDTREAVPQIASNGSHARLKGPTKAGELLARFNPEKSDGY